MRDIQWLVFLKTPESTINWQNKFFKMSVLPVQFNLKAMDQSDHVTKSYIYSFM